MGNLMPVMELMLLMMNMGSIIPVFISVTAED